jgi:hypothetical protein
MIIWLLNSNHLRGFYFKKEGTLWWMGSLVVCQTFLEPPSDMFGDEEKIHLNRTLMGKWEPFSMSDLGCMPLLPCEGLRWGPELPLLRGRISPKHTPAITCSKPFSRKKRWLEGSQDPDREDMKFCLVFITTLCSHFSSHKIKFLHLALESYPWRCP